MSPASVQSLTTGAAAAVGAGAAEAGAAPMLAGEPGDATLGGCSGGMTQPAPQATAAAMNVRLAVVLFMSSSEPDDRGDLKGVVVGAQAGRARLDAVGERRVRRVRVVEV